MTKRILVIGSCNACPDCNMYGVSRYAVRFGRCLKLKKDLIANPFGYISIPDDCPLPKKRNA